MNFNSSKISRRGATSDSLWFLLGLRSSLGFRLTLLFLVPGALSPFFIDRSEYGGSELLWIGLILIAHVGFSITILLAGKMIHGDRLHKSRPVATLLAFVLAQSVRGSILGFATVYLGFTDDPKLAFRILSGGVFISTVLSVIAISIAVFDQHSILVKDLEVKSNELKQLRSSMDTRLQEATRNLKQYAQQVIAPRIDQIDQLLASLKTGGDKDLTIREMQEYVDTELRPFSHQIAHDKSLTFSEVTVQTSNKNFELPKTINISQSMRPFVTTILFLITYVAAAQRSMTFVESLPFTAVTTILLVGYFLLFQKMFGNREIPLLIGVVIGTIVFAIIGPLILFIESFSEIQTPQHISQATVVVGIIYGMANLAYTILRSQRTRMVSELTSTIESLESTISLLAQKEWIARRQVSYVMHGSLQSALNAAILQLGATRAPTAELIESVRGEIVRALVRVGYEPGQSYSFEQAKQEISKIWAGTLEIKWVVVPEAYAALRANPATSECLAEVVLEAISNASKHGRATSVEIVVTIQGSVLSLQVIDNGTSSNTGKTLGLGSELFQDVCTWWHLESSSRAGMILNAKMALIAP